MGSLKRKIPDNCYIYHDIGSAENGAPGNIYYWTTQSGEVDHHEVELVGARINGINHLFDKAIKWRTEVNRRLGL